MSQQMAVLMDSAHATCGAEVHFRVLLWMQSRRQLPTVAEIQLRWRVSRSTAFRWRAAYRAAAGMLRDAQQGVE